MMSRRRNGMVAWHGCVICQCRGTQVLVLLLRRVDLNHAHVMVRAGEDGRVVFFLCLRLLVGVCTLPNKILRIDR
jgi:hypothetical protein